MSLQLVYSLFCFIAGGLSSSGHQGISLQGGSAVQSSRHEFLALQKLRRGQLSSVFDQAMWPRNHGLVG